MKKKYILVGILMKVAYDKFMAQTEFGKKWTALWEFEWFKEMRKGLFSRKETAKSFFNIWKDV